MRAKSGALPVQNRPENAAIAFRLATGVKYYSNKRAVPENSGMPEAGSGGITIIPAGKLTFRQLN
ncbi:MAG TPA: hypothetical protein GX699_03930 [Firmicutes bacterium]|nr:hypothetical protein [Bacillota bacterium]